MSTPPSCPLSPLLLAAALCALALAPPAAADQAPGFFDGERFRLVRAADGARLRSDDGIDVAVPAEWLRPPEVVEKEKHHYVSSLDWDEEVTAFPIGDGLLGLHQSSYTISREGSARAASGRDLFLVLDPADDRLPCTGLLEVPLIDLIKSPVDFLLERYRDRPPLFRDSGRPVPDAEDAGDD